MTRISRGSSPKAVIFTHFGGLYYGRKDRPQQINPAWINGARKAFSKQREGYKKTYTRLLRNFISCSANGNKVRLIYAYVDWALRMALPELAGGQFKLDSNLLIAEDELVRLLKEAERDARKGLGPKPPIHYIGIQDLLRVLNNIASADRSLLRLLCGPEFVFTYDSPKFVESVIRLARGEVPHLAGDPIIRIDEDVQPNEEFIDLLVNAFQEVCRSSAVFLFSGSYGEKARPIDELNDYAVRTHWVVGGRKPKGRARRQQIFLEPGGGLQPGESNVVETFLSDLAVIGAPQRKDTATGFSTPISKLVGRRLVPKGGPQLISGAGLIMSRKAISMLPPFTNFQRLTVWVDDYLKRRMHEAIEDLHPSDLACLEEAKARQERHSRGVTRGDIEWAKEQYFERLLRGCLSLRLVSDHRGNASKYANLIRDIAWGRLRGVGVEGGVYGLQLSRQRKATLRPELKDLCLQRYDDVMSSWRSKELKDSVLGTWAHGLDKTHRANMARHVAKDAISYISVLLNWPVFVRAIQRLPVSSPRTDPHGGWLFDPVDL